jgi:hypothetical protein
VSGEEPVKVGPLPWTGSLVWSALCPVERPRVYYKGEGGGFPQVWAVMSLVCPCCPWLILAPKVLQLCTNHFVRVVCRPVLVNKLVNFS